MNGRFEVYQNPQSKKHYFKFTNRLGMTLIGSQGYKNLRGCLEDIDCIRDVNGPAVKVSNKRSVHGRYSFEIIANNGRIVATSKTYSQAEAADRIYKQYQVQAVSAEVVALQQYQ